MFRHSDIIVMGAYTALSSCLAINGADSCYSTTGLAFQLYRHHFGTIPVTVTGNAPQHPVSGTVGVDKPTVSSGSDTYPLDVAAAFSADRKSLTVAVVNPTESAQKIKVMFDNVALQDKGRKWELAAKDLQSRNVVGQEPEVKILETSLGQMPAVVEVVPLSISLYEFQVR